jgi:hypothetical protein
MFVGFFLCRQEFVGMNDLLRHLDMDTGTGDSDSEVVAFSDDDDVSGRTALHHEFARHSQTVIAETRVRVRRHSSMMLRSLWDVCFCCHGVMCVPQVISIPRQALHEIFLKTPDLCRRAAKIESAYLPGNDVVIDAALKEVAW